MKRVFAVVVLVVLLFNCAPTLSYYKYESAEKMDAILVSERVGETIDTEEAKQFGLFTEIAEFKKAELYWLEDGGYVFEISTDGEKFVAINRDPKAVMILRDYISEYEDIGADRTSLESKWGVLDYDTLGVPITVDEVATARKQISRYACTWGAVGCFTTSLLGIGLGVAFVFELAEENQDEAWIAAIAAPFYIAAVLVVGLFAGAGVYLGSTRTVEGVVKMIKEARKPRVVE
jgi:hypothetical protein